MLQMLVMNPPEGRNPMSRRAKKHLQTLSGEYSQRAEWLGPEEPSWKSMLVGQASGIRQALSADRAWPNPRSKNSSGQRWRSLVKRHGTSRAASLWKKIARRSKGASGERFALNKRPRASSRSPLKGGKKMARKGRMPAGLARYGAKHRRGKKAKRSRVRRRRNDWPGQPLRHTAAGLKGSFRRRRISRSRRGGLLRAGLRRRRSRLARGFRHNPALQYMLPLMKNSPRRRRSSRRRNPVRHRRSYRRSGYRRNPALSIKGIQSQVMDLFSMDTLSTAGWGAAGAFGAMTLPALPVVARFNKGFIGYAMNLAATAVTATLAGIIPGGNGRRAAKVAAGGAIATLIRAGGDLFPAVFPMTLTARPLDIPGLSDATSDLARRIAGSAAYGMHDYRTGLEDYRTGLEDWRTGMEGTPTGMYGNEAETMATGLMH